MHIPHRGNGLVCFKPDALFSIALNPLTTQSRLMRAWLGFGATTVNARAAANVRLLRRSTVTLGGGCKCAAPTPRPNPHQLINGGKRPASGNVKARPSLYYAIKIVTVLSFRMRDRILQQLVRLCLDGALQLCHELRARHTGRDWF